MNKWKFLIGAILVGLIVLAILIMGFKKWSYEKMLQTMLTGNVTQIEVNPERLSDYQIIDARAQEEYNVSHLKNAERMDFDSQNFDGSFDSNKPVLVYCSIGYRSEKLGEMIKQKYPKLEVFNLKGGIFQWINEGKPIVDNNGSKTSQIHTYNKAWSIWVNSDSKVN